MSRMDERADENSTERDAPEGTEQTTPEATPIVTLNGRNARPVSRADRPSTCCR